jgi:hypothetical protein
MRYDTFILIMYLHGRLKSQNDFLREWIRRRTDFLNMLLELEALPGDGKCDNCRTGVGEYRCSDCLGGLVHCHKCFMERHKLLAFHRIERWNGKFFDRTSLYKQGYIIHLGHRGQICRGNIDIDEWVEDDDVLGGVDLDQDHHLESAPPDGVLDIVHTTGLFRHRVRWCGCRDAPDKAMQLFQMQLFPASLQRPSTAFSFDSLDHFYMDAMECKTAAASFVSKICRLTNNAFPHMVPVSQ